jgi:hypothetical protein
MPEGDFSVVLERDAPRPLPFGPGWPEFIGHDPVADQHMPRVREAFIDYSLVLVASDNEVVAGGWGVPLQWNGSVEDLPAGWDGALSRAVADLETGRPVDTFCAMATEVMGPWRGLHLSERVLAALRDNARAKGLRKMIAPARPTLKARYPLTPIDRYAAWHREDGSHFDPWIRIHTSVGAQVLAPATESMVIVGTVSEWESWASMKFPDSGRYVVPEALDTLHVDREHDVAQYIEPAIWVRHPDAS